MKKIIALLLMICTLALPLAACSNNDDADTASTDSAATETDAKESASDAETPETVEITDSLGTVQVPYDPQTIAILDLTSLDIIDALGVGDRVAGVAKSSSVYYLTSYTDDDNVVNLGSVKEVDMETLNSIAPDVIFIGGRLTEQYDSISEIAPTICISTDYEIGYMESLSKNVNMIASLFGLETEASALLGGFDQRVEALKEAAEGKTAISAMITSSSLNTMGNDSQAAIIFKEIGMDNLAADVESTHGDSSSFELLLEKNPEYMFILDRDTAINAEGAETAQEVMENEIVMKTDAYQNDNIIYLTPDVWYLASGGISSTDIMLQNLEGGILK